MARCVQVFELLVAPPFAVVQVLGVLNISGPNSTGNLWQLSCALFPPHQPPVTEFSNSPFRPIFACKIPLLWRKTQRAARLQNASKGVGPSPHLQGTTWHWQLSYKKWGGKYQGFFPGEFLPLGNEVLGVSELDNMFWRAETPFFPPPACVNTGKM